MTDFRALCADLVAWAEKTSAHYYCPPEVLVRARAARRPKPPRLKEQALAQLDAIQLDLDSSNIYGANTDTIRRALEQLPN